MHDYNRLRVIFFYAFGLYLATSVVQLHARQLTWHSGNGITMEKVWNGLSWHLEQIAQAERDQGYGVVFGN